jgi:hypothetical protein
MVSLPEHGVVMMLYSYCLRFDDGAAPNPYWGICTLVICKPAIRRKASVGDWVVGLGAVGSPIGNLTGQVVYAMRVTQRMSMREYDTFCRKSLPGKVPHWDSVEFKKRVGDCIYDFSGSGSPRLRPSVHDERNREVDLSGENALLSEHFYYFGDQPRELPEDLRPIVHQTQGHKSRANSQHAERFVTWIEGLGLAPNQLHGEPQLRTQIMEDPTCRKMCSTRDLDEDQEDRVS